MDDQKHIKVRNNSTNPARNEQWQEGCYRSLLKLPFRRYELRGDFIAINAAIHLGATSRGD